MLPSMGVPYASLRRGGLYDNTLRGGRHAHNYVPLLCYMHNAVRFNPTMEEIKVAVQLHDAVSMPTETMEANVLLGHRGLQLLCPRWVIYYGGTIGAIA